MAKKVSYLISILKLHLDYVETARNMGEYEDAIKVTKDAANMMREELLPKLRQEQKDSEDIPF